MKVKDKVKKIIDIIILVLIISFGLYIMNIPKIYAKVVSSAQLGEIFKDDLGMLNFHEVPVHLFEDYNITLWCAEHGADIDGYIKPPRGATEAHYHAYFAGTSGVAAYDENSPLKYYKREATGLVIDHRDKYKNFVDALKAAACCDIYTAPDYEGDDQEIINQLESTLPGIGKDPVTSIEYEHERDLDVTKYPGAAYVLTASRVYTKASEMPKDGDYLTSDEMELGYFNINEKQAALWEKDLGVNIGNDNNWVDRNLGDIAIKYQEFYKHIHSTPNGYEDLIEAHPVDKEGNIIEENKQEHIEETETEIEGKNYKTYKYKDTVVEPDMAAGCYVLGPYCIDYTLDDENIDVYHSTPTNEVKFNAIEKITVYNQNKVDIETLGGSFKIAYSYNGAVTEENEGKVKRISDKYYYEYADYKEVSGFDSLKPFYIVVYRGSMSAKDFTGFYAKIDFQYLQDVTSTMAIYHGYVNRYYYIKYNGPEYKHTYVGSRNVETQEEDEETGTEHACEAKTMKADITCDTFVYEMIRERTSDHSQQMLAYSHDGWRFYKTYSIVLTSSWAEEERPRIELYKECLKNGEALYGAKFMVNLDIQGKNIHDDKINESVTLSRTTDTKGLLSITTKDLESRGVYLGTFTGTIIAKFTEKRPPASHIIVEETIEMTIKLEKGKIVDAQGKEIDINNDRNSVRITAYNNEGGTPKIQIAKVNSNNDLIEEAYFEIQVAYTDPNGARFDSNGHVRKYGSLIDKKYNIIRGQTKKGYLNLTKEDFANMDYGFDIENYTGKLTLKVTEIAVSGGYSISSDSLIISLEYEHGILINYTEDTSDEVLVHYLYDDPLVNIYKWSKGEATLYPYVENILNSWIKEQQDRTGMKYEDVLAWLIKYIESDEKDPGSNLDEWKVSTLTTTLESSRDNDIIQIIVEDKPGNFELPEIPDEPEPNPILMKFAGTVFLDQTTTKGSENESDGKLGPEEDLIYGIEVGLYEADTGKLAELVQKEGEIRTNPTMTDKNGHYEFRGVDPLKKYYVEFKYNGIEYRATDSQDTEYNSAEWAVTSKGSEIKTSREKYKIITPTTSAYDYYEIKGIYEEIANRTIKYITENNKYPEWSYIENEVKANHQDDKEIAKKLSYIKDSEAIARAGYSSINPGGTYAHESLGDKFLINDDSMNAEGNQVEFAGDTVKVLYPGQLQIHLGIVERDSTDLELLTDIVETTVSMNRYDTTYDYYEGESGYHQYIYEEDYNFSKTPNNNGIAYYTEDNVHFYITYEALVKNTSLTPTALVELVDYYNKEFNWQNEYTTTKGNKIKGFEAWYNDTEVSATVSDTARYGTNNDSLEHSEYKAKYVTFGTGYKLKDGDTLRIRLTYELTGNSDNAKEVLYKYLCPAEGENNKFSKVWEIPNYAEINAYATEGGYLDTDSHPGNFSIREFEDARTEYQKAYQEYVASKKDEEKARALKLALTRLTNLREDDAWRVGITLTNSGYVRELSGNAWEAINDKVKSSLDLQSEYGQKYVEWSNNKDLALGGIKVELVELLKGGDTENGATQVVRAVTKTNDDGSYRFSSYIAGDYTVRFIYGDYANRDEIIYSKVSTNTYEVKGEADKLPINGQYYQSTKANPDTDKEQYWYKEKQYSEDKKAVSKVEKNRYSDAYDDAYSRLTQMNAKIENAENSTSSEYDYDGVIEVETVRHTDPIYAYTSTMELEVEYIRPEILGNDDNSWYEYKINNIDFGVTPRSYNDVNIDKYVSNIKLYKEGEKSPLINANFDKDGNLLNREEAPGSDYVSDEDKNALEIYRDGVIRISYEQLVQQRAHLEITYTIVVTNDSLYDAENKVYDTIKYITNGDKTIAVVYYNEPTSELVNYESLGKNAETIIYHNALEDNGYSVGLAGENRNQVEMTNDRLMKYNQITGYSEGQREIIKSAATNIVDYPNQPLDFVQKDHNDNPVNKYWIDTNPSEFVSSREKYSIENGEIKLGGTVGTENSLLTRSHTIKATHNTDTTEESPLYKVLMPGESTSDTLVLQHTLSTTAQDITGDPKEIDLSAQDDEYSNIIEITRLANSAGKVIDIEGYDITGNVEAETSKVRNSGDVDGDTPKFTPTLTTGKSQTVVIAPPAGLNIIGNVVESNLGIVLIALVVLAIGLILIKKFVLVPKK